MPNLSTITPETRKEEFLDRIARAAASPNLPEVTDADDGKVLTVIDGEWAAGSGGGSVPATREDIGKYLGVKESETETEVVTVISQQTSTIDNGFADLNNCNVQFFKNAVVGDTIAAVIDNTEMTLTATDMGGNILFINGNHAVGMGPNDIVLYGYLGAEPPARVTISATAELPLPETDWLVVPGPLVVNVQYSISNATYNTVKEAIDRGACVRFIYNREGPGHMYCGIALSYEYDSEAVDRPYIVYVIRPDYDVEAGVSTTLDAFTSTNADTDTLALR